MEIASGEAYGPIVRSCVLRCCAPTCSVA